MNIQIKVDCESPSDLHTALNELKRAIRQHCKKNKINPLTAEFEVGTYLETNNCYGSIDMEVLKEEE